ncbi:MAG: glycosyltransferase family 39 protein [Verrucomicrobia bacterium]|nr:glycosyltransferase family 39 protein [Verrucomicrobiota bacterium]
MEKSKDSIDKIRSKWWTVLGVILLLGFMVFQAISSLRQKSVTTDEIMYIAAGYYHLETGDFRLNMTNTPLMKMLTALPVKLTGAELPPMEGNPGKWNLIEQWKYSREFHYGNSVSADRILFMARMTVVFLAVVLGIYVFRWSRELFGLRGAFLSLFLFSFSPNILAHARLASQDFGLAAFMLFSTYYFWQYMKSPRLGTLILCGILAGCAFMIKTTAMFLAPIFGAFILICIVLNNGLGIDSRFPYVNGGEKSLERRDQVITAIFSLGIIGLLTLLVINLGYGFQGSFRPLPLPEPFITMLKTQKGTVSNLGGIYFAGKLHPDGLWYLTLVSFLIKVPIPFLILLGVALAGLAVRCRQLRCEWLLIVFVGVLIFTFSFLIKSGTGLRYSLGVFPFLHVLAGSFWKIPWQRRYVNTGLLFVLGLWYLVGSLGIHPHYLAYFNESVGGAKNGYKYLTDANLDWGQDLKGLSNYMHEKGLEQINLGYFGSADADYYGINYKYLPSVGLRPIEEDELWWYEMKKPQPRIEPAPGTYAISSSLIARPVWMNKIFPDTYEAFRDREPDAQIGHSILIFNITETEVLKQ